MLDISAIRLTIYTHVKGTRNPEHPKRVEVFTGGCSFIMEIDHEITLEDIHEDDARLLVAKVKLMRHAFGMSPLPQLEKYA